MNVCLYSYTYIKKVAQEKYSGLKPSILLD